MADLSGAYYGHLDSTTFDQSSDEPGEQRYRPSPVKSKTCRDCGKVGLRWGNATGGRWVLFDGNAQHVCAYKLNPSV